MFKAWYRLATIEDVIMAVNVRRISIHESLFLIVWNTDQIISMDFTERLVEVVESVSWEKWDFLGV